MSGIPSYGFAHARVFLHLDAIVDTEAAAFGVARFHLRHSVELDGQRHVIDPATAQQLLVDDVELPLSLDEIRQRIEACQ